MTQRIEPGTIYATPGALNTLALAGETAIKYLLRHMSGDWGDICDDDKAENEYAMVSVKLASIHPAAHTVFITQR